MKSLKCRLGFHDWETIIDRPKVSKDGDGLGPWLYDELCIRTGCHELDLLAAEAQTLQEKVKTDKLDRKNIANEKAKLHVLP